MIKEPIKDWGHMDNVPSIDLGKESTRLGDSSPGKALFIKQQTQLNELLKELLEPICDVDRFESLQLHILPAGDSVGVHTDRNCNDPTLRVFHIIYETNDGCWMKFKDTKMYLKKHHLYEVNYSYPHETKNEGNTDRINLFMEARIK
jgi:hypothetical protein